MLTMFMVEDLKVYQKLSERAFQLGLPGELHLALRPPPPPWRGMVSKYARSETGGFPWQWLLLQQHRADCFIGQNFIQTP